VVKYCPGAKYFKLYEILIYSAIKCGDRQNMNGSGRNE
jgi:hypothetical protein